MKYFARINGTDYSAQLLPTEDSLQWLLNGSPVSVELDKIDDEFYLMHLNGRSHQLFIRKSSSEYFISVDGKKFQFALEDEKSRLIRNWMRGDPETKTGQRIQAPMPGLIIELLVIEGQEIKKGETVVIIEAMKMENEIKATANGKVTHVLVEKGESVDKNAILLTVE